MKYIVAYLSACLIIALLTTNMPLAQETVKTRIGDLSFTHDFANGYPTASTQELLFNEIDFQRACQAYLWSIPIVSMAQWQYANNNQIGAKNGQIIFEESYDDKLGGLTYNTTTPYVLAFIDLSKRPWVIELPEGELRGAWNDMWQIAFGQATKPGK
jgi:hypothetical protein